MSDFDRNAEETASGRFGATDSSPMKPPRLNYHHSKESPLTTLEEVAHEGMTRSVSTILNTVEHIQAMADEFNEHITMLDKGFKAQVMAKI